MIFNLNLEAIGEIVSSRESLLGRKVEINCEQIMEVMEEKRLRIQK